MNARLFFFFLRLSFRDYQSLKFRTSEHVGIARQSALVNHGQVKYIPDCTHTVVPQAAEFTQEINTGCIDYCSH